MNEYEDKLCFWRTCVSSHTIPEALAFLSGPEITPCRLPDWPEIPPFCPRMFISCCSLTPRCTYLWILTPSIPPHCPSALWVNWLGISGGDSEVRGCFVQEDCVLVNSVKGFDCESVGRCCLMMVYLMLLKAGSCRSRHRSDFHLWDGPSQHEGGDEAYL